ncbi:MAG: hypothetical protein RIQ56_318 [Candidatus Parcubacteria bacterium]|jgi:hypothetical protein
MTGEVNFGGKQYISSKRAAELSGYSQDYIGQLARGGYIDARRVGGLWYVEFESLQNYEKHPKSPKINLSEDKDLPKDLDDIESYISFDGKDYISASRAAKLSGYHQDYVGQLARSGHVLARQIGNRWYVDREGILSHKKEKDALLAAVQSEAVGLQIKSNVEKSVENITPQEKNLMPASTESVSYTLDNRDLFPSIPEKEVAKLDEGGETQSRVIFEQVEENKIPIKLVKTSIDASSHHQMIRPKIKSVSHRQVTTALKLSAAALTVVIVISLGVGGLKEESSYAGVQQSMSALAVSGEDSLKKVLDFLVDLINPKLEYERYTRP